jgi:hypothetical protein
MRREQITALASEEKKKREKFVIPIMRFLIFCLQI